MARTSETYVIYAVAMGTAVATAIGAQIALDVPGSPVPVTLQSFTAIAAGFLGRGAAPGVFGMLLYLGAAALGAPVLAEGAGGLDALTGSSAGYLVGLAVSPAIGWGVADWFRGTPRLFGAFIGAVVAHLVILALGVAWLTSQFALSSQLAIDQGALPFLPGGLMKSGAAAVVAALADVLVDKGRKGR